MILVTIDGVSQVLARLDALPATLRARLLDAVERLTSDAYDRVLDRLGGGVLQRKTGRLMGAVTHAVADDGTTMSGTVSVDRGAAPYAAIQEYGGETRAHAILPKTARALVFQKYGRTVFAKRVNHPGSRIPERSFLRSALAELEPQIHAALAAAASDAVSS